MHAIGILQRFLCPLLKHVHARRLTTLLEAVVSCVGGPALSLTDVGRRFAGEALLRHKIKRADRLLGNRQLQQEAHSIYAALCRVTLARVGEPVILIDWSDLKADQSLHLLRASLPVGGRALTLYEEVHPQKKLGNRAVQHRFLQRLGQLLPGAVAPIIVADSGFKVPFYRAVERLGWRWVGRVRGRDCLFGSKPAGPVAKSSSGVLPRHQRLSARDYGCAAIRYGQSSCWCATPTRVAAARPPTAGGHARSRARKPRAARPSQYQEPAEHDEEDEAQVQEHQQIGGEGSNHERLSSARI